MPAWQSIQCHCRPQKGPYQKAGRNRLGQHLRFRPLPPKPVQLAAAGMENNPHGSFLKQLRGRKNCLVSKIYIQQSATQPSRSHQGKRFRKGLCRPRHCGAGITQQADNVESEDRVIFSDQDTQASQRLIHFPSPVATLAASIAEGAAIATEARKPRRPFGGLIGPIQASVSLSLSGYIFLPA